MSDKEEKKVSQGFDRGVDYKPMKKRLIAEYKRLIDIMLNMDEEKKNYIAKRRLTIHKIIYLIISMIQLRNGSRISEACKAFKLFLDADINDKVLVKISKSETTKKKKDTGEEYVTKIRHRKMMFPKDWIDTDIENLMESMKFYLKNITQERLRKRVLDYLLLNFECNTHSLRYAFINYMLYDLKRPMTDVAKFVGHSNINQLLTYTQLKNTEQIFDMDI